MLPLLRSLASAYRHDGVNSVSWLKYGRAQAPGVINAEGEAYNLCMAEQIFTYGTHIVGSDGRYYQVRCLGEPEPAGTWIGWLEFRPMDGSLPVSRTDHETSQPNRDALAYWATGLEPLYLEGAFARAR